MADADVVEAKQAVEELYEETLEIRNSFQSSLQELNQQFRTIDECFNKQRRQLKKYKAVESLIKDLPTSSQVALKKEYKDVSSKLTDTKKMIDDLGKSKRRTGSVFLRWIMGHVSVKLWNEGERLQFKQEYNRFKETFLPFHVLLPLIQLYFGFTLAMHQIQSFFIFYYYASLAIRENILRVNGSRIQAWWIYHHYITLVSALLMLLVNDKHPLVTNGITTLVNINMLWQSIVMIIQIQYQRQRHYINKALAKKNPMDVRTTEVIDENPQSAGLYRFLIPLLFLTYAYQLFVGLAMAYVGISTRADYDTFGQYMQVWLLAGCTLALPFGNCGTLLKVLSSRNENPLNMKNFMAILFVISQVMKNLAASAMITSMHLFKSLTAQTSKLRSKSKKSSSSSSSSSKKKKDTSVTTSKKSG